MNMQTLWTKIRNLFNRDKNWRRLMVRLQSNTHHQLKWCGTEYGGKYLPLDIIQSDWICYSGGIGTDISFDEGLIKDYGCQVFAFDPTPKALDFIKNHKHLPEQFHFYPVGLWYQDTKMKFYEPSNPTYDSYSILNLRDTNETIEADCKGLSTLMREFEHDRIDVLKLDIEGAELTVIPHMIEEHIKPQIICVEYDQATSFLSKNGLITYFYPIWLTIRLRHYGYQLVKIHHYECTYVKNNL
jgi:FkbM family methyltransferase